MRRRKAPAFLFCKPESTLNKNRPGNADIIRQLHEDGPIQSSGIEHDLLILLDERISQHLKLVVERIGRNRPDGASGQRLSLFARSKRDALRAEMSLNPIKVNAAIARDVDQAIDAFFFPQPHLHYNGFDRLLEPVTAYLCYEFRPPLRFMFNNAINRTFPVKQRAELFMDVGGHWNVLEHYTGT